MPQIVTPDGLKSLIVLESPALRSSCIFWPLFFRFLLGAGELASSDINKFAVWAAAMTIERVIDFIVGKVESIWSETDVQLEVGFGKNDFGE
jgi:hypothetical protein